MATNDILQDKNFIEYLLQSLAEHQDKLCGYDDGTVKAEFTQEFFKYYWLELLQKAQIQNIVFIQSYLAGKFYEIGEHICYDSLHASHLNLIVDAITITSSYASQTFPTKTEGDLVTQLVNKIERDLLGFVLSLGQSYRSIRDEHPESSFFKVYSFNIVRKSMATVIRNEETGGFRVFVKGASVTILSRCKWILQASNSIEPFGPADVQRINKEIIEPMASNDLRTICIAYKDYVPQESSNSNDVQYSGDIDWEDEEAVMNDLTCLVIVGIQAHGRPEAGDATQECEEAGINHENQGIGSYGYNYVLRSLYEVCKNEIDFLEITKFKSSIDGNKLGDATQIPLRSLFLLIILSVTEWIACEKESCPHVTLKEPKARLVHACYKELFKDYAKDEDSMSFIDDKNKDDYTPTECEQIFSTSNLSSSDCCVIITSGPSIPDEIENESLHGLPSKLNESATQTTDSTAGNELELLAENKNLQYLLDIKTKELKESYKYNTELVSENEKLQQDIDTMIRKYEDDASRKQTKIDSLNDVVRKQQVDLDLCMERLSSATIENNRLQKNIEELTKSEDNIKNLKEEIEELQHIVADKGSNANNHVDDLSADESLESTSDTFETSPNPVRRPRLQFAMCQCRSLIFILLSPFIFMIIINLFSYGVVIPSWIDIHPRLQHSDHLPPM